MGPGRGELPAGSPCTWPGRGPGGPAGLGTAPAGRAHQDTARRRRDDGPRRAAWSQRPATSRRAACHPGGQGKHVPDGCAQQQCGCPPFGPIYPPDSPQPCTTSALFIGHSPRRSAHGPRTNTVGSERHVQQRTGPSSGRVHFHVPDAVGATRATSARIWRVAPSTARNFRTAAASPRGRSWPSSVAPEPPDHHHRWTRTASLPSAAAGGTVPNTVAPARTARAAIVRLCRGWYQRMPVRPSRSRSAATNRPGQRPRTVPVSAP